MKQKQIFIRKDKLHLIVSMRSNDLFMGFCYDIAIFRLLHEKMLVELQEYFPELKIGHYYHNANSMNIYNNNYEKIQKIWIINMIILILNYIIFQEFQI